MLTPEAIGNAFPGLHQQIDYIKSGQGYVTRSEARQGEMPPVAQEQHGLDECLPIKKPLWLFLDPESNWF